MVVATLPEVTLRFADKQESEQLYDLLDQLGYRPDREQLPYIINQLNNSGTDYIIAAFQGEQMVGWLHATIMNRITSGRFTEIVSLVVDKNFRRRGIGMALIEQARNWSASNGLSRVRVRVNSVREGAHHFYENIGFVLHKDQRVFDLEI